MGHCMSSADSAVASPPRASVGPPDPPIDCHKQIWTHGADKDSAQILHPGELMARLDTLAQEGALQCYVELLAKPAQRQPRVVGVSSADADAADPVDD